MIIEHSKLVIIHLFYDMIILFFVTSHIYFDIAIILKIWRDSSQAVRKLIIFYNLSILLL